MKRIFTLLSALAIMNSTEASVQIQSTGGWFESGFVTWTPIEGASNYNVYYRAEGTDNYIPLDSHLVRRYAEYGRADVLGIKAGNYQFKVVPVNGQGEMTSEAAETETFIAEAHDRSGFAHFKSSSGTFDPAKGIGAYQNDGTLKNGAKVFYVHKGNAKTITTEVITDNKGGKTKATGIQSIIDLYQKGYDQTPIDFRIIGQLSAEDIDHFSSSAEGLQIKGNKAYSELNITIEGVGNDATIYGFGFLLRNACSVELRNFAIMWCKDDAVSMDTDNSNLWIHNLDLFYGQPGSDSDQAKGDGTLDIKGDSRYSTLSYNHLWDSGKASLCGMTSETGPNYLTYHHNWFDHSDSRHPRIRTMSVHVYNNYYDGNSKYGIGATTGSDVFAENNYFRACKYPMLISKQGSDVHNGIGSSADTKGTFSGEEGGSIKALGNYMIGHKSFEPYIEGDAIYSKHFDAYVVKSKQEQVPQTVLSLLGENSYSNFDTDKALMYQDYICHEAMTIPTIVTGTYGAGRCQHGDFSWTFDSEEDANDAIITELKNAIQTYTSTWLGFYNDATPSEDENEENEQDNENNEDNPDPFTGLQLCHFTGNKPSLSFVSVTGNYSNSKGSVSFGGTNYNICVKMETATDIKIAPSSDCKVTLIFGGVTVAAGKRIKLDDKTITLDNEGQYTFQAQAGTSYTLKKSDSINLFLILFNADETGITELADIQNHAFGLFDLNGKRVLQRNKGNIYINDNQKIIIR